MLRAGVSKSYKIGLSQELLQRNSKIISKKKTNFDK